ncbi:MAG: CBS domain containing-hemolysin-like protein [Verrucomicrobiales bacterium]|jgi:CBS domain containing-hemolysin-like protein
MTAFTSFPQWAILADATAPEFESSWMIILRIFAILGFVLLNGFFVAAEFAIVKVRSSQLDMEIVEGSKRATLAKHVVDNLDGYLSATQLGITVASIALGLISEPFFEKLVGPMLGDWGVNHPAVTHALALTAAFTIPTFLHVVLGELLPKSLAIRRSLPTTLKIVRPLHGFYLVFKPAIKIFNGAANLLLRWIFKIDPVSENENGHSAEELRILVQETEKSKEVTEIEREILVKALALNDRLSRDVMLPRSDVISLDIKVDFEANYRRALDSEHTRFPLVDGHLDEARGLVHVKDLMKLNARDGEKDLTTIERPLEPVPEMMPLDKLLKSFLDSKAHMALVVDEFGGSLGIVTLDHVLEELVGDIQDEFDNEELEPDEFTWVNQPDEFLALGSLSLYEISEMTGLDVEDAEVSTVGGFITSKFGHLPKEGEQVQVDEYLATVIEADERIVKKVQFRKVPKTENEEEESES